MGKNSTMFVVFTLGGESLDGETVLGERRGEFLEESFLKGDIHKRSMFAPATTFCLEELLEPKQVAKIPLSYLAPNMVWKVVHDTTCRYLWYT